MHVNNSEQWTEYDRPGSQWFISLHQDGKHAVINCRRQMQGLGIPVEAAKAIIEACKLEEHPETSTVETVTQAWAVVRKDGQIQHLDGGLAKRLAVFRTKEDAERDCDKKDEVVVPILVVTQVK